MSRVVYKPLTVSRIFLFYVCPLLSLTSLRLTLVPNQLFPGWSGFLLFLAVGIAATAYWLGRSQVTPVGEESSGLIAFRFVALSALFGLVAWALIAKWLPWTIAELVGEPYTRETAVNMESSHTRRGCKQRLVTPAVQRTYPNFICADGKELLFVNGTSGNVRFSGKRTLLGATVDHVELTDIRWFESAQPGHRSR